MEVIILTLQDKCENQRKHLESYLHRVGHSVGTLQMVASYYYSIIVDNDNNNTFKIYVVHRLENVQTFSFNILRIYITYPATFCLYSLVFIMENVLAQQIIDDNASCSNFCLKARLIYVLINLGADHLTSLISFVYNQFFLTFIHPRRWHMNTLQICFIFPFIRQTTNGQNIKRWVNYDFFWNIQLSSFGIFSLFQKSHFSETCKDQFCENSY